LPSRCSAKDWTAEAGLPDDSRLIADARQALAACLIALDRTAVTEAEAEAETESIQLTAP
jgi:hypothetical protein